jgi:hypothetical protein
MTWSVKNVGKALACIALFLFLYLVVGLSYDRSSGLAILLALLLFWRVLKPSHFEPYWVWIKPNWYQLLLDYGLISNLEEWQRITAELQHIPTSDYNVIRDGIRFTVLKPDLIYRNDDREFASDVKFTEPLREISLISSGGWQYHPSVSIGFAIQYVQDCAYEIRVTAPDSVKHVGQDENGRVVVALLPWVEFGFYREEFNLRRWDKLRAKRDKQMQEHGWTRDESEPYHGAPHSVKHKYFTVLHKRI